MILLNAGCHLFILLAAETQSYGEKEAESQIFSAPQRLRGEKEISLAKLATEVIYTKNGSRMLIGDAAAGAALK